MNLAYIYKRLILLIIISFVVRPQLFAIQDRIIEEGKSAAMANTSVTLTDVWSIYHNQAGLGYLQNISIGAFHQSGFIKEQNIHGISFALPTKTGTIGASYSYYGFSQYNEMQAGLAYGKSFSKYFAIGLQLNYLNTHIAGNYGNSNSVNFEIGILSQPIDNLLVGVHVYNPSRSKMGDEEILTIFNLGASYLFSDKVLFAVGTEKDLDHDAIFKAGLDYKLIEYVSLQAGISTNPSKYSFGIGIHYININGHVGFSKHQTLGFIPSFTLSYGF
ncbi:MAG: hypothetical protein C0597_00810 [Marinilabiliales bacterium]|nr:MAG: hypothetical protein C0597_00810 [Marinilabiliales bacterium]